MCRQQKEAENREEGKFGTEEKPKEEAKKQRQKKSADRRLRYAGQSKAPLELHKGPHQFSECIFFFLT